MSENIQNLTCEYAEEVVSYLYDEMNSSDKSLFEKHLKDCSPCREELEEFSFARSAVQEWNEKEFAVLPTPQIIIPYPKKAEKSSRSLLASIRDLLTLSPAWMTASTALAALAICLGLIVVVVNSLRDNDNIVQQTEKDNPKIISSPTTGNQNSNVSNSNQNKQTTDRLPEPPISNGGSKTSKGVDEPLKISTTNLTKPQNTPVKTVQPKTNIKTPKTPLKTQKQNVPRLIDEDEEEDSLTLTDLLEEIGTREIDD